MKLNYKRTFFVGLAFMSICAFWQVYDNVIPLILKGTFHVRDSYIGIVMLLFMLLRDARFFLAGRKFAKAAEAAGGEGEGGR